MKGRHGEEHATSSTAKFRYYCSDRTTLGLLWGTTSTFPVGQVHRSRTYAPLVSAQLRPTTDYMRRVNAVNTGVLGSIAVRRPSPVNAVDNGVLGSVAVRRPSRHATPQKNICTAREMPHQVLVKSYLVTILYKPSTKNIQNCLSASPGKIHSHT